MADISKVTLPSGDEVNFKDSHVRSQINNFLTSADAQTIYGGVENLINTYVVHPMSEAAFEQITPMYNVIYTVVKDNGVVALYLGNILMAQGYAGETSRFFGMVTLRQNMANQSIIIPNEVIHDDGD